jgi:hypothetical protein
MYKNLQEKKKKNTIKTHSYIKERNFHFSGRNANVYGTAK